MNTTSLFKEWEDFDEESHKVLQGYQNDFLDFDKAVAQGYGSFSNSTTAKTFQEISNEIAVSTPFGDESFLHSNFKEKQQRQRYIRDIFSLMDKNCISEMYYTHNPKNSTNTGFLIYVNKNSKRINLLFSKGQSDNEGQSYYYQTLKENCNVKVSIDSGGNFVIKGKNSSSWKVVNSKYYHSFPYNLGYYKNKFSTNDTDPSSEELKQVYVDFLSRKSTMMLCKNHIDFDGLVKKIQQQLAKNFYNNVNTSVYIKQVDANDKVLKENFLKTNPQKPWEIKLNITLKPNGEVSIKHVASDVYLKKHEEKWKKEAKARGLDVDINALRKQVINDFESKSVENSFYQKFVQESKALLEDSIVGYVEGIQVTQKIGKNVWEEGVINQSTWLTKDKEHTSWPKYAQIHPLVGGVTDGAIDEIAGIPLAIKGVYEIVTDEEKQKSLQKIFTKDGAKQMLEGIAANTKETLKDGDKTQHFAGQTVVSVASMISGAGLFSKAGKIDDIADLGADLSKAIPDAQTTGLLDNIRKTERHVDNDRIFKELKEQIDEDLLEDLVKDGTEEIIAKGKKLSFKELQVFWKRGNDFNEKSKKLKWYENNEIWMTHPTKVYPKGHKFAGKPKRFRLDSWDKGAGMIVSRKATNLAEINKDTFIKYCNEISEKYPPGSKIANSEIGDKLYGKYYLEIPDTNLKFDKIDEYKKIAENLSVELIFKPE